MSKKPSRPPLPVTALYGAAFCIAVMAIPGPAWPRKNDTLTNIFQWLPLPIKLILLIIGALLVFAALLSFLPDGMRETFAAALPAIVALWTGNDPEPQPQPKPQQPRPAAKPTAMMVEHLGVTATQVARYGPEWMGRPIRIGRATDNILRINDGSVSRYHAVLIWANDCMILEDLGSMNGMEVNGAPVKSRQRITVPAGRATVSIGQQRLRFTMLSL